MPLTMNKKPNNSVLLITDFRFVWIMQPNTARYHITIDKRTWATKPFSKNDNGHVIRLFDPGILDKTRNTANKPAIASEDIARKSQHLNTFTFEKKFICLGMDNQL